MGAAPLLIFPGGDVAAAELAAWRDALAGANDEGEIAQMADAFLRAKLRVDLADWKDAPPGPRRVIEVMAELREEALKDLDRRRAFAVTSGSGGDDESAPPSTAIAVIGRVIAQFPLRRAH